jgi:hypothetical protein
MSENILRNRSALRKGPNEYFEVATGITCVVLTRGRSALIRTIDLEKIIDYRWYASRRYLIPERGPVFYAVSSVDFGNGKKGSVSMHRLILDAPPDLDVDHIDGNGFDNSDLFGPLNIKLVTIRQNAQNLHSRKRSSFPGVSWSDAYKKFQVYIRVGKARFFLGRFDDDEIANALYRKACAEIEEGTFVPPLRRKRGPKARLAVNTRVSF